MKNREIKDNVLYPFQEEAIKKILEFYDSGMKHAKVSMSEGLGEKTIICHIIEELLTGHKKCKILLLCGFDGIAAKYSNMLETNSNKYINVAETVPEVRDNGVFVSGYNILIEAEGFNYNQFDFIICTDLGFLYDNGAYPFFDKSYEGKRLSFISGSQHENNITKYDSLIFEYHTSNAISDGYLTSASEKQFLNHVVFDLLKNIGFDNIELDYPYGKTRLDAAASYHDKKYIFELKTYRDRNISYGMIKSTVYQFEIMLRELRNVDYSPILITTCLVDESDKALILENENVVIWDISNLIYFCSNSKPLMEKLSSYVPFPIDDIKAKEPIIKLEINANEMETGDNNRYDQFQRSLNACNSGKSENEDKEYERICTEIIKYLFESEFLHMSTQYRTEDDLFRMDMICSLKGTKEFWKFLIQFYQTKFVVFEYKNYTNPISQNLIYITSKYLFPAALRNVAFIISRHGLDKNAEKVVKSQICQHKKLIISLTDEDLLIMVALKEKGGEPSDYLMEKVENMLMSLSI